MNVNEFIRLTSANPSQRGWIWSTQLLTNPSWLVEFEFRVHGNSALPGDGFAFWYAAAKESEGPVFGSVDKPIGLGVFFDTYMNGRHPHAFPYISSMVGDGFTLYDGSNDGKANEIGSCVMDFRNKEWPTKARVKYVRDSHLTVSMNLRNNDEWDECFLVPNVTLPETGYIGFTSHTGDVFGI